MLLPQAIAPDEIDRIFDQMRSACADVGAIIVGGHTEVTDDLTRPIVMGTLLGAVARDRLITPDGAQPGDAIILTKRLAVEATSLMAREKAEELSAAFDEPFLQHCRRFLHEPGISVLRDAQIAAQAGHIHAMHDPTEGGVATALNEMAVAAAGGPANRSGRCADLSGNAGAVRLLRSRSVGCHRVRIAIVGR